MSNLNCESDYEQLKQLERFFQEKENEKKKFIFQEYVNEHKILVFWFALGAFSFVIGGFIFLLM